jgi:hypothetical protein
VVLARAFAIGRVRMEELLIVTLSLDKGRFKNESGSRDLGLRKLARGGRQRVIAFGSLWLVVLSST